MYIVMPLRTGNLSSTTISKKKERFSKSRVINHLYEKLYFFLPTISLHAAFQITYPPSEPEPKSEDACVFLVLAETLILRNDLLEQTLALCHGAHSGYKPRVQTVTNQISLYDMTYYMYFYFMHVAFRNLP